MCKIFASVDECGRIVTHDLLAKTTCRALSLDDSDHFQGINFRKSAFSFLFLYVIL